MNITVEQESTGFVARTESLERRGVTPSQALKALVRAMEAAEVPPKPYLQKAVLKGIWNLHTTKQVHLFLADDEAQARAKADTLILQEHGWILLADGMWRKGEDTCTLEEALFLSKEGLLWIKM